MDMDTGDPYLDEYNNTVPVDNDRGFEQIIDGLFNCETASELFNLYYGFDLRSAMRDTYSTESNMYLESLVIQALDPSHERLIEKVENIEVIRDGGDINITIHVTSVLNNSITTDFEVSA